MPTVNLPPGCSRVKMEDGKLYRATRPGGKITVSDEHARDIDRLRGNGEGGLIHATAGEYAPAAGAARECCGRRWYAFTKVCPKCGGETVAA